MTCELPLSQVKRVLHPNASLFIGSQRSKSKLDLLKKAYTGRCYLKGFEGEEVDLRTFDWESFQQDRNWWWQLQSHPFLDWYLSCYELLYDCDRKTMLHFCETSLMRWYDIAHSNKDSPLVWHDHATARRLWNIALWTAFVAMNDLIEHIGYRLQSILVGLIEEHVDYLIDEDNYSLGNNHGLDQMLTVYKTCLLFSQNRKFAKVAETASMRLINELKYGFSHQGVHKENSPEYHKILLARVEEISRLRDFGAQEVAYQAARISDRAYRFLQDITLPSGLLPLIGDTKGGIEGIFSEPASTMEVLDYTASGYCIVRGKSTGGKPFHLVFKCGHLSDYHRHDDDLSIHLWFEDELILGDGGLGSYNERDERRSFLRSGYAHNTIFPVNLKAVRKRGKLKKSPEFHLVNGKAIGESWAFGQKIRRTIEFDRLNEGIISITDEVDKHSSMGLSFCVNFLLGPEITYTQVQKEGFFIRTMNHCINIQTHNRSEDELHFFEGWTGDPKTSAVFSSKYGEYSYGLRAAVLTKSQTNDQAKDLSVMDVISRVTVSVMSNNICRQCR